MYKRQPVAIENGTLIGGFAHAQVTALADKVVDAVKSGTIRKFFVMAGCDGRMKSRESVSYTHLPVRSVWLWNRVSIVPSSFLTVLSSNSRSISERR